MAPVPFTRLRGPVGNGMENHPDDVLAVKRRLHRLGLYDEPDYGFTGFIDRGTTEAVKRFQRDNDLKIDGWLAPGGETERAMGGMVYVPEERDLLLPDRAVSQARELGSLPDTRTREASTRGVLKASSQVNAALGTPELQAPTSPVGRPANNNEPVREVAGRSKGAQQYPPQRQPPGNLPGPTSSQSSGKPASSVKTGQPGAGWLTAILALIGDAPTKAGNFGRPGRVEAERLVDERRASRTYSEAEREAESQYWREEGAKQLEKARRDPRNFEPADPTIELGELSSPGDWIVEGLNTFWATSGDPQGGAWTRMGNNIIAQQCREVFNTEFVEGVDVEHAHGADRDGTGERQKEELIRDRSQPPSSTKGARRPDLTWVIRDSVGKVIGRVRLQTQDVKADGTPTLREADAIEDIRQRMVDDIVDGMRKLDGPGDVAKYTADANSTCRRIFRQYLKPAASPPLRPFPSNAAENGDRLREERRR
jgi:hypothetical protein